MAWSEKAIQAALDALPMYTLEQKKAMGRVLDAAAAVDGDAGWNAALEAAANIEDEYAAERRAYAKDKGRDGLAALVHLGMADKADERAARIRSLKRLK